MQNIKDRVKRKGEGQEKGSLNQINPRSLEP